MHSLSRRLLISVSLPLALFFGVMMYILDTGFRVVSDQTMQQLLDTQMVALVAAAEKQPDGGYAPPLHDVDSRLSRPRSGLFAQIRSVNHQWRSPSAVGTALDFGPLLAEGGRSFSYGEFGHDRVAIESRGLQFEDDPNPNSARTITFSVAVSLSPYEEQLWRFRRRMLGWFTGLMLVLLVVLAALLHWVLAPVRRLEREIHEVEEGRSEVLGSGYPRELSGVATNLNALLVGERKRVARYRDTLGNLAHSLKTPLAVMQSALSSEAHASAGTFGGEIDRMKDIIAHQLNRAAASGGALLGQAPVDVEQLTIGLRATLLKVYADKDLSLELAIEPDCQFVGDRGDFTELLGNLMDNACKWCRSHVRVAVSTDKQFSSRQRLTVVVEDDGPGISEENRARVLERGVRTDETVPGHGLGLAMVRDTVDLYGGSLSIDRSPLGGARFTLQLPGR